MTPDQITATCRSIAFLNRSYFEENLNPNEMRKRVRIYITQAEMTALAADLGRISGIVATPEFQTIHEIFGIKLVVVPDVSLS
jgi:hypothetical protein